MRRMPARAWKVSRSRPSSHRGATKPARSSRGAARFWIQLGTPSLPTAAIGHRDLAPRRSPPRHFTEWIRWRARTAGHAMLPPHGAAREHARRVATKPRSRRVSPSATSSLIRAATLHGQRGKALSRWRRPWRSTSNQAFFSGGVGRGVGARGTSPFTRRVGGGGGGGGGVGSFGVFMICLD